MQIFQPITSTCFQPWLNEMKSVAKEVEIITVNTNKNIKNEIRIPSKIQSSNTSFLNDYVLKELFLLLL